MAMANRGEGLGGGARGVSSGGGKVGRAVENKVRAELKMPKGTTTGKAKATKRNTKVKEFMNPITKGKNKDWAKEANKSTNPGNSRRAKIKESSINTRLEKHPLVRNAGNASSETKYRVMRGKPVPVKKKSK